ncbi:MAG: glycosyltransferase [Candidatus Aminicenantaceae bacterium]
MDISIVMPAFNESQKIKYDVEVAASFICDAQLQGEIIVVDDGSTDNTSEAARNAKISSSVKRIIIRLWKNSGKGFAVKAGIKETQGDVVLFADSGTCIPYSNAKSIIKRIRSGDLELAHASRRLKDTKILKDRAFKRKLLAWLFHQAAVWVAGLPRKITDSQCGFKLYKGEIARKLFEECVITGYLFDLEILLRAVKLGYRIEEFPVEWSCDLDSRLRPGPDTPEVLKDLFKLRAIIKKIR